MSLARAALCATIALAAAACARSIHAAAPMPAHAGTSPMAVAAPVALPPQANPSEAKFIRAVAADLNRRFPASADARRGGYVRYTAEDQDGIISYTNLHWFGDDPKHPTQLWYDAAGRLIGTDFTMPVRDKTRRPEVWGLRPGRWVHFIAHMHYVVREADGTMRYGSMFDGAYREAGGDPNHPTAQPLVKAGVTKRASDVRLIFQLPEIWITSFWVIPNRLGAFADSNPDVKPTKGEHQSTHPAQPTP